ncbi:MAG: hypothetical protein F2667_07170 [Actinobacteria bacterium]|uniref:Unannotated protein n=1 Tax=freshwater metagenome TaxID=449393 RepID=A0A6J6QEF3_9ZZZZ|nr:hypothetical protein [Actinomycetota bacterium]
MSVFDEEALIKLGRDLTNMRFALQFAQRYRTMLAQRVDRILLALQEDDAVEAMDATLSLKVASTTVGTVELADLALLIEVDVRSRELARARELAARLPDAAARADRALADYLVA